MEIEMLESVLLARYLKNRTFPQPIDKNFVYQYHRVPQPHDIIIIFVDRS